MVYHSIYGERVKYKLNKTTLLRQNFARKCREKYLYPVVITELIGKQSILYKDLELPCEG